MFEIPENHHLEDIPFRYCLKLNETLEEFKIENNENYKKLKLTLTKDPIFKFIIEKCNKCDKNIDPFCLKIIMEILPSLTDVYYMAGYFIVGILEEMGLYKIDKNKKNKGKCDDVTYVTDVVTKINEFLDNDMVKLINHINETVSKYKEYVPNIFSVGESDISYESSMVLLKRGICPHYLHYAGFSDVYPLQCAIYNEHSDLFDALLKNTSGQYSESKCRANDEGWSGEPFEDFNESVQFFLDPDLEKFNKKREDEKFINDIKNNIKNGTQKTIDEYFNFKQQI